MSNLSIYTYEKNESLCPTLTGQRFEKSTSEKYKHISTSALMQQFFNNGFELVGVSANKTRSEAKRGFQKHVTILTRPDLKVDEENQLQLLLTNSHDGSSSLRFNIGIYRFVCANGIVVGDTFFDYRVRHSGDSFIEKVQQGIEETLRVMPMVAERIKAMQGRKLDAKEIEFLVSQVARLRLGHKSNVVSIARETIGSIKRKEDIEDDLYTVFNRCQESLIRGGTKYQYESTQWQGLNGVRTIRNATTRAVKSPTKQVELNKQLWDAANLLLAV